MIIVIFLPKRKLGIIARISTQLTLFKTFFFFLKKWLQATDLTREVYQHLAHCVPKIYCRGPNPYPQKEDTLAQHILLGPMEWYICGEDPALGFPKLEQANKPSHLCGRVFKVGEPTYSCR